MTQEFRILFIEDLQADAEMMKRELKNSGINFLSKVVDTKQAFAEALVVFCPDIIICDHSLPQFDSITAIKMLNEMYLDIPFILVTGALSDECAVEHLKQGAFDYVLKANLGRLPFSVKNALSKSTLIREKQSVERANEQLKKYNRESAEKNKNMTDSMVYAKGIQAAMLPDQNFIHKYFPESFLINMPKDIVSGDFYWFSEYEGKFIVAVGDCTGHGVPAALISMMGYNKLNYIVNRLGVTEPAQILDHLNFEIREIFQKDSSGSAIRDGMDISVCMIDKKNNRLEYAGANRPLYYINDKSLEIIKADKKCIGGLWNDDKAFTNHSIPLNSVNSIYLFTDGFMDQFGGAFGKKFLCKRFKSLISSVFGNTMNDQKELLVNTLQEWKGDAEQTDDICVLGIRI